MSYCSQLLSWSFVHESLSTLNGSQEVCKVGLVLDASSINSIVELSSENGSSDLLGQSLSIERSWESSILLGGEGLNCIDVVASRLFLELPMGIIIVSLGILIITTTSCLSH